MRTCSKNIHLTERQQMKKILVAVLSTVTIFAPMQIAKAADERVVAIIDSAIDSNKNASVIYEACFTTNTSCPNGKNFMEGKGAASYFTRDKMSSPLVGPIWPTSQILTPGKQIYHGYNMAQVALKTSPNVKIVFIRISDGFTNIPINAGDNLSNAIKWVNDNAAKYSIDAVSISQSRVNFADGTCPTDLIISNAVKSLNDKNIPTFAATGNEGLQTKIGFPSCLNGIISVGALYSVTNDWATVTNRGPGLDVVAIGDMDVIRYNGTTATQSGTSVATAVAAAKYVGQTSLFDQFIAGMTKFVDINKLTYPFIK